MSYIRKSFRVLGGMFKALRIVIIMFIIAGSLALNATLLAWSAGSLAIGAILKFVRDVVGNPLATCYEGNTMKGEWTLGLFQTYSLRKALGVSRKPSGGKGLK